MTQDSPELRELKKQTEMMAPRHIANGAVGMGLLAMILYAVLAFVLPAGSLDWIGSQGFFTIIGVAMALGAWLAWRDVR